MAPVGVGVVVGGSVGSPVGVGVGVVEGAGGVVGTGVGGRVQLQVGAGVGTGFGERVEGDGSGLWRLGDGLTTVGGALDEVTTTG